MLSISHVMHMYTGSEKIFLASHDSGGSGVRDDGDEEVKATLRIPKSNSKQIPAHFIHFTSLSRIRDE